MLWFNLFHEVCQSETYTWTYICIIFLADPHQPVGHDAAEEPRQEAEQHAAHHRGQQAAAARTPALVSWYSWYSWYSWCSWCCWEEGCCGGVVVPIAVAVAVDSFVVILVSMSTECLEYSKIHFHF